METGSRVIPQHWTTKSTITWNLRLCRVLSGGAYLLPTLTWVCHKASKVTAAIMHDVSRSAARSTKTFQIDFRRAPGRQMIIRGQAGELDKRGGNLTATQICQRWFYGCWRKSNTTLNPSDPIRGNDGGVYESESQTLTPPASQGIFRRQKDPKA